VLLLKHPAYQPEASSTNVACDPTKSIFQDSGSFSRAERLVFNWLQQAADKSSGTSTSGARSEAGAAACSSSGGAHTA